LSERRRRVLRRRGKLEYVREGKKRREEEEEELKTRWDRQQSRIVSTEETQEKVD
jgi:hypothetical protein